jgi:hypothetical protein
MEKKLEKIPEFETEDEERDFWATHDSTEYFDWDKAQRVIFPNLNLTLRTIKSRSKDNGIKKG